MAINLLLLYRLIISTFYKNYISFVNYIWYEDRRVNEHVLKQIGVPNGYTPIHKYMHCNLHNRVHHFSNNNLMERLCLEDSTTPNRRPSRSDCSVLALHNKSQLGSARKAKKQVLCGFEVLCCQRNLHIKQPTTRPCYSLGLPVKSFPIGLILKTSFELII